MIFFFVISCFVQTLLVTLPHQIILPPANTESSREELCVNTLVSRRCLLLFPPQTGSRGALVRTHCHRLVQTGKILHNKTHLIDSRGGNWVIVATKNRKK